MANSVKKIIAKTFEDIANGLETGSFGARPKIAVTGLGSEHGEETVLSGAVEASEFADVLYIGTLKHDKVTTVTAKNEKEAHEKMEELLHSGEAAGAVTMHFPFPIGVSTVGKASTPALGRNMYIATTTGTSATDRVESMIKNALYGIICAKACGNENPTVGILNIDGARQTESALKDLAANGYKISFGSSQRADGGCVLRGNDVLTGACDILVTDPLTGNILIKMLSSFNTGGRYEAMGCGYGPGIGKNYNNLVMIVSRASGSPVISGAITYAAQLVKGDYAKIAENEFAAAEKAGLNGIIEHYKSRPQDVSVKVAEPPKEVVTEEIAGVEITTLDDAVAALWKDGIYAQSGMGCTGPVIMVSEAKLEKAEAVLKQGGWLQK
jgi:hypothetical protein